LGDRVAAHLDLASLSDIEYAKLVYALGLRREADPEGLSTATQLLSTHELSRASLLEMVLTSEEFRRVRVIDDAVTHGLRARTTGEPAGFTGPPETDERVIELPWALARYGGEPRVLDVGSAFAEPAYLTALMATAPREIVGVDLAAAEIPGMEMVVADVRELPFGAESFDVIFCISTLEHVGRDNSRYGVAAEADDGGMLAALFELRRVLARTGRLLATVPCGKPQDYGWWFQHDVDGWNQLFEQAGFAIRQEDLYLLDKTGWRPGTGPEISHLAAYERGPGASGLLCAELVQTKG
jgi:SAM-dependent methyltransferase